MTAQVHETLIYDGNETSMAFCPPLPENNPRVKMLTDEEIYAISHVPPGSGGMARLRLRRIRRGVRGVPRTVRALAQRKRQARL